MNCVLPDNTTGTRQNHLQLKFIICKSCILYLKLNYDNQGNEGRKTCQFKL